MGRPRKENMKWFAIWFVVILLYVVTIYNAGCGGSVWQCEVESRLDTIEASLHSAQQPNECHYLIHQDTLFIGRDDWILIKQPCVMGLR